MNPVSFIIPISLLVFIIIILGWRDYILKRRIELLTDALRDAANAPDQASLPQDVARLEELSNAIAAFHARLRQQLENANAESAQLAAVLAQTPDGILIANAEGQVQFANPAAQRLLDSPSDSLIGCTVAEALRYHQLIETWQKSVASGKMQSQALEMPLRHRFLQLLVAPDQHTPGGSFLLVQDLTRLRRLETVRRDFISNLSHELRTPLASLKALTETLQGGALNDPPAAQRFLGRIETEVDALTQMAQELLDLSRIESGQVNLELRAASPLQILQRAAERMRLQADRADIHLRLDCPHDLPFVQADAARIEQVLVNLIHNGIKFTSTGGAVTLSAQAGSRQIRFAVSDTGAGIPASDLPRIFERFYKSDRARSSRGAGLGLAISKHLIEAHGGRIWAESSEGRGSVFYFSLPISS